MDCWTGGVVSLADGSYEPPPWLADALAKSKALAEEAHAWHERNRHSIDKAQEAVSAGLTRGANWIEANRSQIESFLEVFDKLDQGAKEIEEQWSDAGLGYLISPLGTIEKLLLSPYAAPGDAEQLFDFIEASLADPDFVKGVQTLLDEADVLSEVSRDHLSHGLSHLKDREPLNAWPPLIIGLEGAFSDVAVERGVAVRDGNHVYLAGEDGERLSTKPSAEKVAKGLGHSVDDSEFGSFLVRQVYGGEGNPFRHGTAREGVRDRSVALAIAVLGWIDAFVAPGARDLLRQAIIAELGRREDADPDESSA